MLRTYILRLVGLAALVVFAWPVASIVAHRSNEPVILGRYAAHWFLFGLAYLLFVAGVVAANVWLWRATRRGAAARWVERLRPFQQKPVFVILALAANLGFGALLWQNFLGRTSAAQMVGMETAIRYGPMALGAALLALREDTLLFPRLRSLPLVALFLAINGLVVYNTMAHPVDLGYDTGEHLRYVRAISFIPPHLPFAGETNEFFSPPLPYLPPAAVYQVCDAVQPQFDNPTRTCLSVAGKFAQLQNILISMGICVYLIRLCTLIRPGSRTFATLTLGLAGLMPVYQKSAAMFRAEMFVVFFALFAMHRLLVMHAESRYGFKDAAVLGVALGLLVLSRQWGFFIFPAIGLWALILVVRQPLDALPLVKALAISGVIAFLIGGWFYLSLYARYGTFTAFNRDPADEGFSLANQPASFYFGLGDGHLFTEPIRPHYANQVIPIFYSDAWGDYWGFFLVRGDNRDTMLPYLGRANLLSLYPTLIFFAGVVAGLVYAVKALWRAPGSGWPDAPLALIALFVAVSFAGFMWFLIGYPEQDKGATIKATYLLQVFPVMAVLASDLLERVKQRSALAFTVLVALLAAVFGHNLGAVVTQWAFVLSAAGTMPKRIVPVIPDDFH